MQPIELFVPIKSAQIDEALIKHDVYSVITDVLLYIPESDYDFIREDASELQIYLHENFFDILYVDRQQDLSRLEKLLKNRRVTVLLGFIGTGKTVTMLRLQETYNNPNYASTSYFYISLEKYINRINSFLFSTEVYDFLELRIRRRLEDDCINDTNRTNWYEYLIQNDDRFDRIRTATQLYKQASKTSRPRSIKQILRLKAFQEDFYKLYEGYDISTLISFLRRNGQNIIVAFDGIDGTQTTKQQQIYNACILLCSNCKIPFLIAFRDYNFKTIHTSENSSVIDRLVKRTDAEAAYMQRHILSKDDVSVLSQDQIEKDLTQKKRHLSKLFYHRLNVALEWLTSDQVQEYTDLTTAIRIMRGKRKYQSFMDLYFALADSLVFSGVNAICNHSIRLMFLQFNLFILSFLKFFPLLKESPKSLERDTEYLYINTDNITQLRTFFYRFLIFGNEEPILSDNDVPNLLENHNEHYVNTSQIILEFLNYKLHTCQVRLVRYSEAEQLIRDFNLANYDLYENLISLERIYGKLSHGYIHLHLALTGATCEYIELLPAGEFFLEELSTSREFAFWCIMNLDYNGITKLLDGSYITEYQTLDSKFKIEVVLKWFEDVGVRKYLAEKEKIELNYSPTSSYSDAMSGSWNNYMSINHGRKNWKWFPIRVIESLRSTLKHSWLTKKEENHFRTRCTRLIGKLENIVLN